MGGNEGGGDGSGCAAFPVCDGREAQRANALPVGREVRQGMSWLGLIVKVHAHATNCWLLYACLRQTLCVCVYACVL